MRGLSIIGVVAIILLVGDAFEQEDSQEFAQFISACSDGRAEEVELALKQHPEWANASSGQGETCLHAAGYKGHFDVTEQVLKAGGDPNIEKGDEDYSMHALSWHVFGGHYKTVELMLQHGADPNKKLDSPLVSGVAVDENGRGFMTVLDMLDSLMGQGVAAGAGGEVSEGEESRVLDLIDLLMKHGGKRGDEL